MLLHPYNKSAGKKNSLHTQKKRKLKRTSEGYSRKEVRQVFKEVAKGVGGSEL
jgi:hypothetical protein